ncbi:MAG: 50S ribosomal protein L18 [Candidatus Krumholzibacteria bacterium]|nr:50S ribosomal protein L18 [Candidatus Krumholzibacteria bacterium]MDH4338136.1 50S ribosomal protein L18 [Candidatus Krumholzibacteria bacterium]MDH5270970.1 50S ribosomal protein L18 [Candidatus Krumholzibacteria bacterium]
MHNPSEYKRWRRHKRVRNRVVGTPERPRVCVFRSNTHIYAQIIDDTAGKTLVSVSSLKLELPKAAPEPAPDAEGKAEGKAKGKKKAKAADAAPAGRKKVLAREVGRLLAEAAREKGVSKVAFDRGGYLYHGRVAELAESARKHGLEF